jgi:hypothetical protein
VSPATVAVTVFVPAVVLNVHDVSAATPDTSVVTVEPLAGTVVAPAEAVNVTTTPLTGLLAASRTVTDGTLPAAVRTVPTVAVCDVATPAVGTMFCDVAAVLVPEKVIGVAMPLPVATTVFGLPAAMPSVHVESDAMPLAFETTVAALVGVIEPAAAPAPPDAVSVNVTLKPDTGLLFASRTITDGAAIAAPTVPLCDVALFATKLLATPATPVAVKVTGLPVSPLTVAWTVFAPATVPSVHEVSAATPAALVVTVDPLAGLVMPLPAVVVNVTTTPCTGLLLPSRTVTDGAVTAPPTVALCVVAELGTMFCALAAELVAVNTTGVAMPAPLAVTVLAVPAVSPRVHVESEATPVAFETTVATLAGLIDPAAAPLPPAAVSVNVTLKPATGLLLASRTMTEGAATAAPIVPLCEVALFATKLVAVVAVPVAVKITGLPARPETVAWTVLVPAMVPNVHEVSAATPDAFVVAVDPLTGFVVPLPAVVVNVTTTPCTGLLFASRTVTDGATTLAPTAALCVVAELAMMFCAVAAELVPVKVIGVPIPAPLAVTVLALPAVRPSVHVESDATPLAFETTVATLAGVIDPAAAPAPPAAVSVKVTLKPATGLLLASRTITDGAATAAPTVPLWEVALLARKFVAVLAVPVAVNVTGLPVSPATVAVTVFVPAVALNVHDVSAATPDASVVTVEPLAGLVVPPPATVKVTTTPCTGLLLASRTVTDGTLPAALNTVPTVAVCEVATPAVGTMFCDVAAVLVPEKVIGVPIPAPLATTVFALPAVRPSVHVESEATPLAFDTTVATLVGVIDPAAAPAPPDAVSVNVTLNPDTGLLFTSRTITDGAAIAAPTVPLCDVALFATKLVATPATPVAVNVTGLPVSPATVAVSVFAPLAGPTAHAFSAATPDPFVGTVSGPTASPPPLSIRPAPPVTVNVTATPATALPPPSRTMIDGAVATAVLTVAV